MRAFVLAAIAGLAIIASTVGCPSPPADDVGREGEGEGESACFGVDDGATIDDLPASFLAALDAWYPRCGLQAPPAYTAAQIETAVPYDDVVTSLDWPPRPRAAWARWRTRDVMAVDFNANAVACLTSLMTADACEVEAIASWSARAVVPRFTVGDVCVDDEECTSGRCSFDDNSPCRGFCVDEPPPVACATTGTCRAHASCDDDNECASGACVDGSCSAALGVQCTHHGECDSEGRCIDGTCQVRRALGEACSDNDVCAVDAVCIAGQCSALAGVGEACDGAGDCALGRECLDGTCFAGRAIGAGCSRFAPTLVCVVGAGCDETDRCVAVEPDGACTSHADCADDAFCEPRHGRCVRRRERGALVDVGFNDRRCFDRSGAERCGNTASADTSLPLRAWLFGDEPDEPTTIVIDEGACDIYGPRQCRDTLSTRECIIDDVTATQQCGERQTLGERCMEGYPGGYGGTGGTCAIGLRCVPDSSDTNTLQVGTCEPLPGVGEPCVLIRFGLDGACDPLVARCVDDVCVDKNQFHLTIPADADCAVR